jgi:hypothetical protein
MGAFITTKLINHKSFVTQTQKEINEHQTKINYIEKEINPKIEYVKKLDYETNSELVDKFLDDYISLIDPNNPPSLEELHNTSQGLNEYSDIDIEILKQKYNNDYLKDVKVYAENLVDEFLDYTSSNINPDNPPELTDLLERAKEQEEKVEFHNIQESVLKEKYNEDYLSQIRKKKGRSMGKPFSFLNYGNLVSGFDFKPLDFSPLDFKPPRIPTQADIQVHKRKWDKYWRFKEEIPESNAELSYYKNLLWNKKNILQSKDEVLSLRNNLITLLFFSITGVFLPLFMMLQNYETMMQYRYLTYFFIFGGWLVILFYLAFEIKKLLSLSK